MAERRTPEDATLLDVLVDGFEKNEVLDGFHWRQLPMPDEASAVRKFSSLCDEARRWKGQPTHIDERPGRRLAAWSDFEIRLAGRGLMVRARTPRFADWWHDERSWQADPMGPIFDWIAEDRQG
jgi:hypothetical protein